MTKQQAKEVFHDLSVEYKSIRTPKYRNVDPAEFQQKYQSLIQLKEHLQDDPSYNRLVNAMSQILAKLTHETTWTNVSDRGMNKAIPPVIKKSNIDIEFPFKWKDKNDQICLINGYWGPKNYMLMDALGYFFLLKEGGDSLPERSPPLFSTIDSIRSRETKLNKGPEQEVIESNRQAFTENDLSGFRNDEYSIDFNDRDFREFTSMNMSSNDILHLIHSTSQVEFKLVFPVRMNIDGKNSKEQWYPMNVFSRFFELAYIDAHIRKDGVVRSREYRVLFNTILGELFVNNLKTYNFDWLENRFYHLPHSAQILYRRLLLHHDFPSLSLNLTTIAEKLNLQDKNMTNLERTIEDSALKPLVESGLITSYEKSNGGLHGTKFTIEKPKKSKLKDQENPNVKT